MNTYVIGDIHGSFKQFIDLLKKINYKQHEDKIILVGDLVNRGPESLAVLNYCMANPNITSVLGNHDLYLLHLMNIRKAEGSLKKVVEAENSEEIFKWLIKRPLMLEIFDQETDNTFFITHAGIPVIWPPKKAMKLALEVSSLLQDNPDDMLKKMWGNHPDKWSDELIGYDRYRIIINYLTRMRFVGDDCVLDLENTSKDATIGFKPWFHYKSNAHTKKNQYFVFGHWASLNGKTKNPYFIGLDTGCAWKGKLTALRLNDLKKISVNY